MSQTFQLTNGDITISDSNGRPVMLEGTAKFSQDVRLTLDAANLASLIGQPGDVFSIRAQMNTMVTAAFNQFKSDQDAVQKNDRLVEEQFSRLAQINVLPLRQPGVNVINATAFSYRVDALSVKGGQATSITGVIVS